MSSGLGFFTHSFPLCHLFFLLSDDFFILINVSLDLHQASMEIKPVLDFHDSRDKTCQWYTCEALRCTCEGEKCKSFTREKNKTKWQLYILKTIIWRLTLLLIVKDQSSHFVYLNIWLHKITNLWKFELDWSSELRNNVEAKHPCCMHNMVAHWDTTSVKTSLWQLPIVSSVLNLDFLSTFRIILSLYKTKNFVIHNVSSYPITLHRIQVAPSWRTVSKGRLIAQRI